MRTLLIVLATIGVVALFAVVSAWGLVIYAGWVYRHAIDEDYWPTDKGKQAVKAKDLWHESPKGRIK